MLHQQRQLRLRRKSNFSQLTLNKNARFRGRFCSYNFLVAVQDTYVQHQVNDVYREYYLGPQSSFEENYGYPGDFGASSADASGSVGNQLQADAKGQNFIVSSAKHSWIYDAPFNPQWESGPFQSFSFSNDLQVNRTAHITNDSSEDVRLTFDYLINAGALEYRLPELTSNEYFSLLFMMDIRLNDTESLWFSGGSALVGERYSNWGFEHFRLLAGNLEGSEYAFTTAGEQSSDGPINHWRYQWQQQQGQMDLGVLKAGESIKLDYFYRTRVRGFMEHCVPTRDTEIAIIGCIDNLGSAQIGYWNDGSSALIDESTVKAVPVLEPSPMYLFMLGVFGIFMARTRKEK